MSPTFRPLISVVIPTYNYGHFVTCAVDSVLAQTYENLDVVVVDDGSTDDTRHRLEPYKDRIRYIYQPNQGLSAARNTGIRAARGEMIALLDSDDVWHPRKLEVQAAFMARHPEVGLVGTDCTFTSGAAWQEIADPSAIPGQRVTIRQIALRSHFGPSSVIIRSQCFRDAGYFDLKFRSAEDREMWIRIGALFPIAKLEATLYWGRLHPESMTNVAQRMEENDIRLLRKSFSKGGPLHGRWLLHLQSSSYTARSAAYMYDANGRHFRGLARIVRSLLLWPFPFPTGICAKPFERLRMLGVMYLRLAKIKARRPPTAPMRQPMMNHAS